jgi:hypothetical protein
MKEELWKAPELQSVYSTNNPNLLYSGTQKGDIYSFGIIVQEILYRKGVFHLTDEDIEIYFKNDQICKFNDKKLYYKGKNSILRLFLTKKFKNSFISKYVFFKH